MRKVTHQNEIEDICVVCLLADTEQDVKGITAPPRMIRLGPVVTAQSTIKPRPRNRTVSANPCIVPMATSHHECAHPCRLTDDANMSLHPIWNGERAPSTRDVKSNGSVTTTQSIVKLTKHPGSIKTKQSPTMPTTTQ